MDCKRISELVPWFVNGTLPDAERSLVGEHLADCASCRKTFDETRLLLTAAKTHIPAEILIDFAEKKIVGNYDRDLFEKHLAACDECAGQLTLASASFEFLEEAENFVPMFEKTRPVWISDIFQSLRIWRLATVSALGLLLLTLGGLFYVWRSQQSAELAYLEQEKSLSERIKTLENERQEGSNRLSEVQKKSGQTIEELKKKISETEAKLQEPTPPQRRMPNISKQPEPQNLPKPTTSKPQAQANVVALDVFPTSVYRSEAANENRLLIPSNATSLTLILNSASNNQFPRYAIELRHTNGRLVWQNSNLKRFSANDFTINLPTDLLRNGQYLINIYGIENGQRTKNESYRIKIDREER